MRAILLVVVLAATAHAEDRTPHQLEGGELERVRSFPGAGVDPYTMGPATLQAPVRIGPGVTAVRTGDGVVVSCESPSVVVQRLREQLRLRTAELAVTRGQLDAAIRRAGKR